MSTLSKIFYDLCSIIYPRRCMVCDKIIENTDTLICTHCLSMISITRFWSHSDNSMAEHMRELQPMIEQGVALLFYDGYSRPMIHRIKYHGFWRGARYLGELLGSYLVRSDLYTNIDVVVPVPIHPIRRLGRKYNQSEYIALGVAQQMGVATNFNTLYRARYSKPQAQKNGVGRWGDDNGGFAIRGGESLHGKHILLVDDVYTSGATIYRCVEVLKSSIPDCKISVATLTVSCKYQTLSLG